MLFVRTVADSESLTDQQVRGHPQLHIYGELLTVAYVAAVSAIDVRWNDDELSDVESTRSSTAAAASSSSSSASG